MVCGCVGGLFGVGNWGVDWWWVFGELKLVRGSLIHVDETDVSIGGEKCLFWVFRQLERNGLHFTQTAGREIFFKGLT